MTTIARHKDHGGMYLVLGGGYGTAVYTTDGFLGPKIKRSESPRVLVTNAAGEVGWLDPNEIEIISVDGVSPARALQPQDQPRNG